MTSTWSIGWRLTVWYITALSLILLIFGGVMTALMNRHLKLRMDAELAEEAKELAEEIETQPSLAAFQARFDRHYAEHGGFSFQVSRLNGEVLCGSPWLRAHTLPQPPVQGAAVENEFEDVNLPHLGLQRTLQRIVHGPSEPLVIQVVAPYAQTHRELGEFLKMLILAGSAALLAACLGGLAIARHALRPLARITSVAERISAENLAISIVVDHPGDELGRLTTTLNRTFQRLRESMQQIRQFTADAAHELRTPLTVMRTRLEVAMRDDSDAGQLPQAHQIVLEQIGRLAKLIDQLLILSRHDAGVQTSLFEEVDLKPLLADVADSLHPAAFEKGVTLEVGWIPDGAVLGDDIALSRLFYNLLDNAIKYTPSGGRVEVYGTYANREATLTVKDTGIGIKPDQLPRVFDRFFRADTSRNGRIGGAGLGLAICKSIVQAHGGRISVSSIPGQGTFFTVQLPLVAEPVEINQLQEARYE